MSWNWAAADGTERADEGGGWDKLGTNSCATLPYPVRNTSPVCVLAAHVRSIPIVQVHTHCFLCLVSWITEIYNVELPRFAEPEFASWHHGSLILPGSLTNWIAFPIVFHALMG